MPGELRKASALKSEILSTIESYGFRYFCFGAYDEYDKTGSNACLVLLEHIPEAGKSKEITEALLQRKTDHTRGEGLIRIQAHHYFSDQKVTNLHGNGLCVLLPSIEGRGNFLTVLSENGVEAAELTWKEAFFLAISCQVKIASWINASSHRKLNRPTLTVRQRECLKWVSLGKTDWEVGKLLGLSRHTVHRHVEAAKQRLQVRTRLQAIIAAGYTK